MFIVFDTENRIFGLPRELVVTVAGKVTLGALLSALVHTDNHPSLNWKSNLRSSEGKQEVLNT